jgi:hypothetical protein
VGPFRNLARAHVNSHLQKKLLSGYRDRRLLYDGQNVDRSRKLNTEALSMVGVKAGLIIDW